MSEEHLDGRVGRRRFLKRAAAGVAVVPMAGGLIAAACSDSNTTPATVKPPEFQTPKAAALATKAPSSGGTDTKAAATPDDWKKIDADHKAGIDAYLKNQTTPLTKGEGNLPLAPRIENGVKVWDLTMDEVSWETIPGTVEKARAYNKMIPGPILRGTVGDKVKINFTNNLTESSAVHWHGLYVPNAQDGVPFITQPAIEPGKTFTYEFTLRNQGSHMYHSHHNSSDQVNRGLLGAFIVDPSAADKPNISVKYDKEYIFVLNDVALGFTLNGKGFPATKAIAAKKGEKVLIRWLNEGLMNHPMHLHGMPMEVFAKDGWPISPTFKCDTLDVAPGNRYDTVIEATEVGIWAFHCHILTHAESPAGFHGLTTVLIVTE